MPGPRDGPPRFRGRGYGPGGPPFRGRGPPPPLFGRGGPPPRNGPNFSNFGPPGMGPPGPLGPPGMMGPPVCFNYLFIEFYLKFWLVLRWVHQIGVLQVWEVPRLT